MSEFYHTIYTPKITEWVPICPKHLKRIRRDHIISALENESILFDNLPLQTDFCAQFDLSKTKSVLIHIMNNLNTKSQPSQFIGSM